MPVCGHAVTREIVLTAFERDGKRHSQFSRIAGHQTTVETPGYLLASTNIRTCPAPRCSFYGPQKERPPDASAGLHPVRSRWN